MKAAHTAILILAAFPLCSQAQPLPENPSQSVVQPAAPAVPRGVALKPPRGQPDGAGSTRDPVVVVDSRGREMGRYIENKVLLSYNRHPVPLQMRSPAAGGPWTNVDHAYYWYPGILLFTTPDCSGQAYIPGIVGFRYFGQPVLEDGAWVAYVAAASGLALVASHSELRDANGTYTCFAQPNRTFAAPAELAFPLDPVGTPPFHLK